ncbi:MULTISPECIES: Cys-tRNA(Pro) deacylase [Thiomicrorhabdus]|uniref:Cys-tRNA(Pro)/Cys-tRNA(Cys) deacylase n=1 Tax=Thiomicrorhabdus heinhorstiae TaxID=2748010 RepID=A0ABS0BYK3_9GAMM|nr:MULTISPECIES: Cys-tRNA(Pro) deacylase [Thiomicrorhabdus]MBF6058875.1 Cys-tRNA(Pro) deacylase [Thiomicrorhabdus heinhorstiae]
MTPAILLLKSKKIEHTVHEYVHDEGCESYGLEAAEKLGIVPERVFKTLVVSLNSGELAVGIVPVSAKLSMKLIAKAAGGKKAEMAAPQLVERSTGYVLGGVSPLGQKKRLKTVLDSSAQNYPTIFVSAGKRGMDLELTPQDLLSLLGGIYADIQQ